MAFDGSTAVAAAGGYALTQGLQTKQRAANEEIVRLQEATAKATEKIADFTEDLTRGTQDAQREFDRLTYKESRLM